MWWFFPLKIRSSQNLLIQLPSLKKKILFFKKINQFFPLYGHCDCAFQGVLLSLLTKAAFIVENATCSVLLLAAFCATDYYKCIRWQIHSQITQFY